MGLEDKLIGIQQDLISEYPIVRSNAARKSKKYAKYLEKYLISLLQDPYYEVRSHSCIALSSIVSSDALPKIIDLLNDPSEECRYSAAKSLGAYRKSILPIEPLIYSLKDLSRETKRQAIKSLNTFPETLVYDHIRSIINQIKNLNFRIAKENDIDEIETIRAIFESLPNLKGMWIENILQIGFEIEDEEIIRFSLVATGTHQILSFYDKVKGYTTCADDEIRFAAVTTLFKLEEKNSKSLIYEFFEDPFEWVRNEVAKAISQIPEDDLLPVIDTLIDDSVRTVKISLISSLASFEFSQIVPYINKLVEDNDSYVRQATVKLVSKFQNPSAQDIIESLINDPDDLVRINVQNTLNATRKN